MENEKTDLRACKPWGGWLSSQHNDNNNHSVQFMKRTATLCLLMFLAACYGLERVDELRKASPAPSAFHQELARLYLAFVDKELDKYDWDSAGYFAGKGLDAAHGEKILPEDPAQWSIPDYAAQELSSARVRVMAKLSPSFVRAQPHAAAQMLFYYDCWVEEQEEAWETSAIESCKQQVFRHFEESDPPVAMGGPLSTSYLFHFPEGKAALDGFASEELELMAQTLHEYDGYYSVLINGHADLAGSAELSQRRADYVRKQLARGGVPDKRIRYSPYSDAAMSADSGNGQRVEIFIE